MIIVLLFFLISIAVLSFIFFKKDILSPTFIASNVLIISTIFAIFNQKKWDFYLIPDTVLIIVTSLFFMGLGELLVHIILYKQYRLVDIEKKCKILPVNIPFLLICLIFVFFCLLLINYYRETIKLAELAGFQSDSDALMIAFARKATVDGIGSRSVIANYSIAFAKAFAYVFSYLYFYNKILCNIKNTAKYLLPVFIYFPFVILTGGRGEFIYITCAWIVLGCYFTMKKNAWNSKTNIKLLIPCILSLVVFFVVFIFVGSLKSSRFTESAFDQISMYTGLSIPSFDSYVRTLPIPSNEYFGEHTLLGVYYFLNKFSSNYPILYEHLEFVRFSNHAAGNVYTAFRRLHQDYGLFGLYFIMFIQGIFYSFIWNRLKISFSGIRLLIYSFIFYPIAMVSIDELFLRNIISMQTWRNIFFGIFFYLIFMNDWSKVRRYVFG